MTRTIGFLTSDEVGLAEDDRRLVAPLERRGFKIVPLVWDAAPPADPPAAIVVRSCWDYHRKQAAFKRWLAAAEQGPVPVWNPPAVLRWNLDKHYLRDLAARGVAIPRTVFVPMGSATSLAALLEEHGLARPGAVLRPRAGGGGAHGRGDRCAARLTRLSGGGPGESSVRAPAGRGRGRRTCRRRR